MEAARKTLIAAAALTLVAAATPAQAYPRGQQEAMEWVVRNTPTPNGRVLTDSEVRDVANMMLGGLTQEQRDGLALGYATRRIKEAVAAYKTLDGTQPDGAVETIARREVEAIETKQTEASPAETAAAEGGAGGLIVGAAGAIGIYYLLKKIRGRKQEAVTTKA